LLLCPLFILSVSLDFAQTSSSPKGFLEDRFGKAKPSRLTSAIPDLGFKPVPSIKKNTKKWQRIISGHRYSIKRILRGERNYFYRWLWRKSFRNQRDAALLG